MANWKLLTIISISIGLIGLTTIIVLFTATGGYVPFHYGIVLDAGSSHTKITLYQWLANKNRCTGVVQQLDFCEIRPGISSYDFSNTQIIGNDLLGCVNNVSQKIDRERLSLTSVYLGATAGMRLLDITQPKIIKIIFNTINDLFRNKTEFQIKTIDIISGQMEGLFSWITNNYLSNRLIVEEFDETVHNSTLGMLDMGGASAQIAYRTGSQSNISASDEINVRLYGINHTVHSSSNLCFGIDQALLRYQKYLIMTRNDGSDVIKNPCLPIGITQVISGEKFRDKSCVQLKDGSKEIQFNRSYTFVGISDSEKCSHVINSELLNRTKCELDFNICFNVSATPPPDSTQFYAISSYYYTSRILKLSQPLNATEYKLKMNKFCNSDNSTIYKEWKLILPKYVDVYCFRLHFIYTTISTVYRIGDNLWPNIRIAKKIGKSDLGWSLGFMINATNAIAAEKPTPPVVEIVPFLVVTIFCTLVLFFSIYFAIKWLKSDDSSNNLNKDFELNNNNN